MTQQNPIETILLSLSRLLDAEKACLRDVKFGDLPNINRQKSEALRRLDRFMNTANKAQIDFNRLELHFDRVRRQARENTLLLGSALNGAKSAADVLSSIQTGEPANRTYTALGVRRPMTTAKRKNNQLV